MTRQKLNSFRSNQIEVSYLVLVSKSKEMCRKFPEIRSLSYFKRINGLEFWCLQIPLKVVTFWDEPKLAKSCPANFVPLKKFRVQNNEHVTPSIVVYLVIVCFILYIPSENVWNPKAWWPLSWTMCHTGKLMELLHNSFLFTIAWKCPPHILSFRSWTGFWRNLA